MTPEQAAKKGPKLAFTALAGLLAGLPACTPGPAVTEVVIAPTPGGGGETTAGEAESGDTSTSVGEAATEDASAMAADSDPTLLDEPADRPKPKNKPKKKPKTAAGTPAGSKNCCAGQNMCKGLGGCKTDQNACMGKNMCKGQGGCRTGNCTP